MNLLGGAEDHVLAYSKYLQGDSLDSKYGTYKCVW